MKLEIITPGALSTVQDSGRFGVMHKGFATNGAMDVKSMYIANRLVGNCLDCAVIEMTLLGAKICFHGDGIIALSGGEFDITLSGKHIERNRAYKVKNNQVLSCGVTKNGARLYLAVQGGINGDIVMGSMSTDIKCAYGGHCGRPLKNGDVLSSGKWFLPLDDVSKCNVPLDEIKRDKTIRAVAGPQDFMFDESEIELFFSQQYTVTESNDRMGIKLDGKPIKSKNGMDIISDGIPLGSVQISSSGKPIVLMADHQTTGGYAKIATVISSDIHILAQAMTGDSVHFQRCSVSAAQSLAKSDKKYFENLVF